jgi:DNA-binding MarR family transcriptional regulator
MKHSHSQRSAASAFAETTRANCLGMRVSRLHRMVGRTYDRALQPLGLSVPQVEILSELVAAGGPVRPTTLAATLLLERSTLSRSLTLLRDKGWVAPADSSPTGRMMAVTITEEGRAAFADARRAWQGAQDKMIDALGPSAREILDGWVVGLVDAQNQESAQGNQPPRTPAK